MPKNRYDALFLVSNFLNTETNEEISIRTSRSAYTPRRSDKAEKDPKITVAVENVLRGYDRNGREEYVLLRSVSSSNRERCCVFHVVGTA